MKTDRLCSGCNTQMIGVDSRRRWCRPGCRSSRNYRIKAEAARALKSCRFCGGDIPKGRKSNCGSDDCLRLAKNEEMRRYWKSYRERTSESYHSRYAEKRSAYSAKRRAITRHALSDGEIVTIGDVFDRDNGLCGLCGVSVDRSLSFPDSGSASLDHIVPLSLGGSHSLDNLQLSHLGCNCAKGNRI